MIENFNFYTCQSREGATLMICKNALNMNIITESLHNDQFYQNRTSDKVYVDVPLDLYTCFVVA